MAGYTDYLNLYYKNPSTDGADTFNIQTMMNDNWDKIDEFASMAGLPPAGNGFAFIRCKDEAGDPVAGCVVQINDLVSVSSAAGLAKFQIAAGTYSALVRAPIDYGLGEQTVSITVYDGKASEIDATISNTIPNATRLSVITSCLCAFSDRVSKADAFGIGGGASGAAAIAHVTKVTEEPVAAATGGGGGNTKTKKDIDLNALFDVSIGSGGDPVSIQKSGTSTGNVIKDGNPGGATTIKCNGSILISAEGGDAGKAIAQKTQSPAIGETGSNGGSGSGSVYVSNNSTPTPSAGNSGTNGNDGEKGNENYAGGSGQGYTTCSFGEENSEENYSQAGGSVAGTYFDASVGSVGSGAGIGAHASNYPGYQSASSIAKPGNTPGSGGGSATVAVYISNLTSAVATSGAGADGLVIFRWEVAS